MLRLRLHGLAVVHLVLLFAASHCLHAADLPDATRLSKFPTADLIELVDETDYDDPFEAHHQLAIAALNELLGRDLTDEQEAVAHYRLAVYHLRTGSLELAMKEIDLAIEFGPEEPEYVLMKGCLLFDTGKSAEGKSHARRALTADPDLLEAQQSYTLLVGRANKPGDERMQLQKSGPLLPMLVHPYIKAATTFYKAEDFRGSLSRINDYLQVAPFDFQRSDDAYMLMVVSSLKVPPADGQPPLAATELVRRGVVAWNLTKSQSQRDEILKSMLRPVHVAYASKSPGTVLALSDAVLSRGNLQNRDVASVYYVRARALAGLGRFAEAVAELDRASKLGSLDFDARALKIEFLTWSGRYADALAECDSILKDNPNHVSTLLLKAQIHTGCPDVKFRNAKAAVELASRACEAARQQQRAQLFNPYKMLVLASAEAGDLESAGEAVKQLRYAAHSVEDVKAVEQLTVHVREHKPWKLEHAPDNSKEPRHKLLYQQLSLSQPNLQLPDLQANYERLCDELLAMKELSEAERAYCLRRGALCRFWQGKLDPAIADIELLHSTSKDFAIYVLLNRALLEKHDEKGAAAARERLKKSGDGSAEYRFTESLVQVEADLYRIEHETFSSPDEHEKLVQQTGERIDRLIESAPQQPVLYQFRASSLYERGKFKAALDDSQRCLDLAAYRSRQEFAGTVYQHALILERLYHPDTALHYAAMTMHLEGPSERSRQLVGRLYQSMGKTQLAGLWDAKPTPRKAEPAVAESAPRPTGE